MFRDSASGGPTTSSGQSRPRRVEHDAHVRQVGGMSAAIHPAHDAIPIHDRRTGQLRSIIYDRGIHIQTKAGRIGFSATNLERRIGLKE